MLSDEWKSEAKTAHADLEGEMIPVIKSIDIQAAYYSLPEMIQKKPGNPDSALHFFNGYGAAAMEMWVAFKEQINIGMQNEDKEAVIKAANDTFNSFKRRIEYYEQQ